MDSYFVIKKEISDIYNNTAEFQKEKLCWVKESKHKREIFYFCEVE